MPTREDAAQAAGELVTALRFLSNGDLQTDTDDPLALKYERACEKLWPDLDDECKAELTRTFTQVFGFEQCKGGARQAFASIVGDGWFRDFLRYTSPGRSTPQLFFGAALAYIAAGFGRAPRIDWEAVPLYPNLYILLLGGTAAGKGAAVVKARTVVQPILGANILPNEGTHQGFAAHLKARYELTGIAADGFIVAEEFKVLVSNEKHKQELITWLTEWYQYDGTWGRALRGETDYTFDNPCVSLLGASNMVWLKRIPRDAILGGFFPRVLILASKESEEPWGTSAPRFDEGLRAELQDQLRAINIPENIGLNRIALEWMEYWYQHPHRAKYKAATGDQVRAWLMRKQACMLKMGCVQHIIEHHEGPICVNCLQWARRILDWADEDIARVYNELGTTQSSEVLTDVMRYLKNNDGRVVEGSIRRGLRNRYRATEVKTALRDLATDGDIVSDGTGPRGTVWKIT